MIYLLRMKFDFYFSLIFQKAQGNLLGIMGTDVPLTEITKHTPQYKVKSAQLN